MRIFNFILLFASFTLIVGIVRSGIPFARYYELEKKRNILAATVSNLTQETQNLEKEINKIRTTPAYAHQVLRDKYHVTEANEEIIFFAD